MMKIPGFTKHNRQKGMSMIELMFAGFILVVGMLGSLILISIAIASNSRNRIDTTGTAVSQMVIEQINALTTTSNADITITDCATTPVSHTVKTAPGGATLLGDNFNPRHLAGTIDFTESTSAANLVGYRMLYTTCGQTVYDVRWNITSYSGNFAKKITVSARQLGITGQQSDNIRLYAPPVTLKSISGP